jgi:hypothetical protein
MPATSSSYYRWLTNIDHDVTFHLVIVICNTGLRPSFISCGPFRLTYNSVSRIFNPSKSEKPSFWMNDGTADSEECFQKDIVCHARHLNTCHRFLIRHLSTGGGQFHSVFTPLEIMPCCFAAGLRFNKIPTGFNAPLEFLTGFTEQDSTGG